MKHLFSWPIKVWPLGGIAIVIVVVGFLAVLQTAIVNAAPDSELPLDCLSCHTRVLRGHDTLGSGSEACWMCHDSITIGKLRLLDGTQLPLADSPPLCRQCHQTTYDAWNEAEHGVVAQQNGEPVVPGTKKLKCIDCHNPHSPKMGIKVLDRLPKPASEEEGPLECLDCHVRELKGHDKLGSGSEACWACHSNRTMGELHLAEGQEKLSLADYPRLCAQCHQGRFEEWAEGTHGAPAWQEGIVEIHGTGRVGCIGCHDPHQPQIALLNITKPHPEPAPSPSPPSTGLLVIVGISVLLVIAVGVVLVTKGEWP